MTKLEALTSLRDKVKAGEWNSIRDEPSEETGLLNHWHHFDSIMDCGSLDAAKALHDAVLPGWMPSVAQNVHHGHWFATVMRAENGSIVNDETAGHATCPARAWLIAILEALIAQEKA
jgi:hypothetical protein